MRDQPGHLAAATTPAAVFEVVLRPALEALGAVAGAVLPVRGDHLEIAPTQGHGGGAAALWRKGQGGPLDGSIPAGHALQSREALSFEHAGDLKRAFPGLETRVGVVAASATAVLPMVLDEQPLGVLILELLAQRQSLEAATEELKAFASSVAHDLRTPVRHVMSFGGLLRTHLRAEADDKASRYLTIVDEAAGRMNTLIDAMLNLSRTSRLPLRLGPVDLGELVNSVRTELEPDVLGRAEWRVAAPLPLVHGDQDTLRQAVTNLLDNALKYTRTREVARIEVWAEERPQEWCVSVRDNGVGFDPRYGNKLFGVFQRLHRAEDFEGTGVGLANVRRIVTRHGGRVSAEGQPGEGATFRFTLPRH